MRRRKESLFEGLIKISSYLPWWINLTIALGSYLFLHDIAETDISQFHGQLGILATTQINKALAEFGQYFVPLIFVIGAIISIDDY